MGHKHSVWDTDAHFKIDAITKKIKNESSKKTTLVQTDHNSERFSFDIPRFIEGHDMMLCDLIEIHFDNKETGTSNVSSDYYEVNDKQISPEDENVVIFSWLIGDTATKYAGTLEFSIKFKCMENGVCTYKWNTEENSDISVSKCKDNSGVVVERAPNVVDQWREQIFGDAENAVANINLAEKNALEAVQAEGTNQLEQIQVAGENIVEASAIAEQNAKNVLANAIKGHMKGEVVTADDVSPVEHEMVVKVKNKNLLNVDSMVNDVFIRNEDGSSTFTKNGKNRFSNEVPIDLKAGVTYYWSAVFTDVSVNETTITPIWKTKSGKEYYSGMLFDGQGRTIEFSEDVVSILLYLQGSETDGASFTFKEMQIEEGTTPTEYTPYIDPATVNVRRCGKNLFDITNFIGKVNTVNGVTAQVMEDGCVHVSGSPIDTSVSTTIDLSHNKDTTKLPKGTYVYSNNAIRANENVLCFPQANNSITGSWLANFLPTGGEISSEFSIRHIVVFIKQGVTGDVSSKFYLQVETGKNATEYEPFKEISTHIPASDGTVSGMMSTAPNMTILTDTEGVMIDCEYIKDTNKVIEKLVKAITDLGGTV